MKIPLDVYKGLQIVLYIYPLDGLWAGTVTDEEFGAIFWVGCVIMKDCIIPWRIFQGDELREEYAPNNHQTFENLDRSHKCGVNNNF